MWVSDNQSQQQPKWNNKCVTAHKGPERQSSSTTERNFLYLCDIVVFYLRVDDSCDTSITVHTLACVLCWRVSTRGQIRAWSCLAKNKIWTRWTSTSAQHEQKPRQHSVSCYWWCWDHGRENGSSEIMDGLSAGLKFLLKAFCVDPQLLLISAPSGHLLNCTSWRRSINFRGRAQLKLLRNAGYFRWQWCENIQKSKYNGSLKS